MCARAHAENKKTPQEKPPQLLAKVFSLSSSQKPLSQFEGQNFVKRNEETRWNGTLSHRSRDLDVKTSTASDFRGLRADSRPQPPKIIDRLRESSRLVTTATTTRKCEKKKEFLKRASNTARDIYQPHLQARFRHGGVHANGSGATESERHVYFILRSKVVM